MKILFPLSTFALILSSCNEVSEEPTKPKPTSIIESVDHNSIDHNSIDHNSIDHNSIDHNKAEDLIAQKIASEFDVKDNTTSMPARDLSDVEYLIEFKEFDWDLKTQEVSDVDSLNGITWKGEVVFECLAYRSQPTLDTKEWSDWQKLRSDFENVYIVTDSGFSLVKKNGEFIFKDIQLVLGGYDTLSCSWTELETNEKVKVSSEHLAKYQAEVQKINVPFSNVLKATLNGENSEYNEVDSLKVIDLESVTKLRNEAQSVLRKMEREYNKLPSEITWAEASHRVAAGTSKAEAKKKLTLMKKRLKAISESYPKLHEEHKGFNEQINSIAKGRKEFKNLYFTNLFESLSEERHKLDSEWLKAEDMEQPLRVESITEVGNGVVIEVRNTTNRSIRSFKSEIDFFDEVGDPISNTTLKYISEKDEHIISPKETLIVHAFSKSSSSKKVIIDFAQFVDDKSHTFDEWGKKLVYPGSSNFHGKIKSEFTNVNFVEDVNPLVHVETPVILKPSSESGETYSYGTTLLKYEDTWPFVKLEEGEWIRGKLESQDVYSFGTDKYYSLLLNFANNTYTENGFDGTWLDELSGSWSTTK